VFLVLLFLLSVASLFAAASFVCFKDSEGEIEGVPCDALVLSVVCLFFAAAKFRCFLGGCFLRNSLSRRGPAGRH
jgi:hypothetical protein